MVEPLPCLACPKCHADTVIALRTAQLSNFCHCSNCGHIWQDDDPPREATGAIKLRPKPDRRRVASAR